MSGIFQECSFRRHIRGCGLKAPEMPAVCNFCEVAWRRCGKDEDLVEAVDILVLASSNLQDLPLMDIRLQSMNINKSKKRNKCHGGQNLPRSA